MDYKFYVTYSILADKVHHIVVGFNDFNVARSNYNRYADVYGHELDESQVVMTDEKGIILYSLNRSF